MGGTGFDGWYRRLVRQASIEGAHSVTHGQRVHRQSMVIQPSAAPGVVLHLSFTSKAQR